MLEMTKEEYLALGQKLFGNDKSEWGFVCPSCRNVQSANSIREQMKRGVKSLRYGLLEEGDKISPREACYAEDCNWVANGLFCGPVFLRRDPMSKEDRAESSQWKSLYIFSFKGQDVPDAEHQLGIHKRNKKSEYVKNELF